MTCFWDGVIQGLKQFPEFNMKSMTRPAFIKFCKDKCDILFDRYKYIIVEGFEHNSRDISEVENPEQYNINDTGIRKKEIKDNHIPRIKELCKKDEIDGYNCSPYDSFLLFICCYFEINIHYKGRDWNNKQIQVCYLYEHPEKGYENNKALFFKASKTHFTYVSYVN
jgi:hypothetical protein